MKSIGFGIRVALLVLCVAVFLVSGVMLVRILVGYGAADRTYESINEGFDVLTEAPSADAATETEPHTEDETDTIPLVSVRRDMTEQMRGQYQYLMELKSKYPNVVGYISIPSLSINYPVVRTDNNDYYLNHLMTGEESATGSIFMDCRCPSNPFSTRNTVIYGHNMNNGAMFHNLELLFELEVFLGATVEYVCEQGILFYKPLSVYRADATYPFAKFEFPNLKSYETFCRTAVAKSRFTESEDVVCAYDSSVITLVTCTNSLSSKTGRYVYQAVLDTVYLLEEE